MLPVFPVNPVDPVIPVLPVGPAGPWDPVLPQDTTLDWEVYSLADKKGMVFTYYKLHSS